MHTHWMRRQDVPKSHRIERPLSCYSSDEVRHRTPCYNPIPSTSEKEKKNTRTAHMSGARNLNSAPRVSGRNAVNGIVLRAAHAAVPGLAPLSVSAVVQAMRLCWAAYFLSLCLGQNEMTGKSGKENTGVVSCSEKMMSSSSWPFSSWLDLHPWPMPQEQDSNPGRRQQVPAVGQNSMTPAHFRWRYSRCPATPSYVPLHDTMTPQELNATPVPLLPFSVPPFTPSK